MTALAIVTADLHLRNYSRTWLLHPELRGDAAYAINQLCAALYDVDPSLLILAGDVFDAKEQRARPLELAKTLLEVASDNHINVAYVTGQHEQMPLGEPQLLSALDSLTWNLHQQVFDVDGVTFAGVDYQPPRHVEHALRNAPPADVLVTHQVWQEFMGETRGYARADWLQHPYKLIITGDYHIAADTIWCNAHGQEMRVISPGPLYMQSISESPEKSYVILYDDLTYERVPLKTRTVKTFLGPLGTDDIKRYASNGKLDELCTPTSDVPDEISKPILLMQSTLMTPPDVQLLTALTKGKAFPFVKGADGKDKTDAVAVGGVELADVPSMLRQAINTVCGVDAALYNDVTTVLDADSSQVTDTLQQIFDREYNSQLEAVNV